MKGEQTMKIYLIEYKTESENKLFDRLQAFSTMEKAQERMKEMHNALVEEYPNANNSCLDNRAHIWLIEGFMNNTYNIADIYIREMELQ